MVKIMNKKTLKISLFKMRISILSIIFMGISLGAEGANSKKQLKKSTTKTNLPLKAEIKTKNNEWEISLAKTKDLYRNGKINDQKMWDKLIYFHDHLDQFAFNGKSQVLLQMSKLLVKQDYSFSAALLASQILAMPGNNAKGSIDDTWELLAKINQDNSIIGVLEALATNQIEANIPVPAKTPFGGDWFYYLGNALEKQNRIPDAITMYSKLSLADSLYALANYQKSLLFIRQNKISEALEVLNFLASNSLSERILKSHPKNAEVVNLIHLTLGRLNYENRNFQDSFMHFRAVTKDSRFFYDALFDQSWAFFMGGYPNHALGALYGAESKFFEKVFNPETSILKADIFYWMCLWDDSRYALKEFLTKHSQKIDGLNDFLSRKTLRADNAYELLENFITGVPAESLGIATDVLSTATTTDSMLFFRRQYAEVIDELQRLRKNQFFRSGAPKIKSYLERIAASLRQDLGQQLIAEFTMLKENYDALYAQSQFLYIELLMSEKDELLGKSLHADAKFTRVPSRENVKGWGLDETQGWRHDVGNEYWWDEVGFYIYRIKPMCNQQ